MPETSSPAKKLSDLFSMDSPPWRYRNDHLLSHVIRTQLYGGRRNITPKHFWRFRKDKSGVVPVFRETSALKKIFDDPIGIIFHASHGKPTKKLQPAMVEEGVDHTFRIDLAECIRLGELYGDQDPKFDYHFYVPRSNDVYQWNGSLYEISDITGAGNGYYEPLQRFIVWEGAAKLLHGDSTDPERPLTTLDYDPEVSQPIWPT